MHIFTYWSFYIPLLQTAGVHTSRSAFARKNEWVEHRFGRFVADCTAKRSVSHCLNLYCFSHETECVFTGVWLKRLFFLDTRGSVCMLKHIFVKYCREDEWNRSKKKEKLLISKIPHLYQVFVARLFPYIKKYTRV